MKAEELLKLLKPNWNYIAKDKSGRTYAYQERPIIGEYEKSWQPRDGIYYRVEHFFDIEFPSDDWRKCIAERPLDYSALAGKWGVFADNKNNLNLTDGVIGVLTGFAYDGRGFRRKEHSFYKYFRPLTDEEKKEIVK